MVASSATSRSSHLSISENTSSFSTSYTPLKFGTTDRECVPAPLLCDPLHLSYSIAWKKMDVNTGMVKFDKNISTNSEVKSW